MAWLQRLHDLSSFSPARRLQKAEWRTRLHTTRRLYITNLLTRAQQRRPNPANTARSRRPAIIPEKTPPRRRRRPPRTRACRTTQRSRCCSGRRPPTRPAGPHGRVGVCMLSTPLSAYSCSRVLSRGCSCKLRVSKLRVGVCMLSTPLSAYSCSSSAATPALLRQR